MSLLSEPKFTDVKSIPPALKIDLDPEKATSPPIGKNLARTTNLINSNSTIRLEDADDSSNFFEPIPENAHCRFCQLCMNLCDQFKIKFKNFDTLESRIEHSKIHFGLKRHLFYDARKSDDFEDSGAFKNILSACFPEESPKRANSRGWKSKKRRSRDDDGDQDMDSSMVVGSERYVNLLFTKGVCSVGLEGFEIVLYVFSNFSWEIIFWKGVFTLSW